MKREPLKRYKLAKYPQDEKERSLLMQIEINSENNVEILCSFRMTLAKSIGQKSYEHALTNAVEELKKYDLFKKVVFFIGENGWERFDCITENGESINDILVSPEMIAQYDPLYNALTKLASYIKKTPE